MDFNDSIDSSAVHMLKGKRGDILRLPGVMDLDCRTNLALQVRDLYSHVFIEIHQYLKRRAYLCVMLLSSCSSVNDLPLSSASMQSVSGAGYTVQYGALKFCDQHFTRLDSSGLTEKVTDNKVCDYPRNP